MTRISVCLACFNGEESIEQQVHSILEQLKSDSELIISDNGSTDGTWNLLTNFKYPRNFSISESSCLTSYVSEPIYAQYF